jgi:hypothetical protein
VWVQSCVKEWLEKRNTCPLCRYELPKENEKGGENEERKHNQVRSCLECFLCDQGVGAHVRVSRRGMVWQGMLHHQMFT